jgi:hypothetical protein
VGDILNSKAVLPPRIERIASELESLDQGLPFKRVQEYLTELNGLTRNADGATRNIAGRLKEAFLNGIEATAAANPSAAAAKESFLAANAAYRKESAVETLQKFTRNAISTDNEGNVRIAPGKLVTAYDRAVAADPLFAKSFTAEEHQQIREGFMSLTGTPRIPSAPSAPALVNPKMAPPPEPQVPTVPAFSLRREGSAAGLAAFGHMLGVPVPLAATGVAANVAVQLVSQAMVSERLRGPVLQFLQQTGGKLPAEAVGMIRAALAAEKKQQEAQ